MEAQMRRRRWIAAGVTTAIGGLALAATLPASAQAVEPEPFEGNPTCDDIAPDGVEWTSFKIEPPTDGEHSDGTLTVDITINNTEDGQEFDWTSNIEVQAVIAKGGPNANVYFYDPDGSTGDSGLHAPQVGSEDWADLSHIDFCYGPPMDGTTTTAPDGTTTTAPDGTTTTVADGTTTTAPPAKPPAQPSAPPPAAPPAPVQAQPTFTG